MENSTFLIGSRIQASHLEHQRSFYSVRPIRGRCRRLKPAQSLKRSSYPGLPLWANYSSALRARSLLAARAWRELPSARQPASARERLRLSGSHPAKNPRGDSFPSCHHFLHASPRQLQVFRGRAPRGARHIRGFECVGPDCAAGYNRPLKKSDSPVLCRRLKPTQTENERLESWPEGQHYPICLSHRVFQQPVKPARVYWAGYPALRAKTGRCVLGYLFAVPPGGTRFCVVQPATAATSSCVPPCGTRFWLAQMAIANSQFNSHITSQSSYSHYVQHTGLPSRATAEPIR